jgi:hypothetical protein
MPVTYDDTLSRRAVFLFLLAFKEPIVPSLIPQARHTDVVPAKP